MLSRQNQDIGKHHDHLPSRFTAELLEVHASDRDGMTEVPVHIGRLRDFEAMLSRYYRLRGWDENGIPTPETLRRLELDKWTW